jgi:hypothetical protein
MRQYRIFSNRWRHTFSSLCNAMLMFVCLPLYSQAADDSFPAKISLQERLQMEKTVCGDPYGLAVAAIDARSLEANGRAYFADVKCRPHAQVQGKPLYYVAQCGRDGNQWSCGAAEVETIVPLRQRELLVRPGTVPIPRAIEALQKISTYGYFQGSSLDKALQSTCNLGMGDTPDLVEISCRRWSVTVSFWCPQKSAKIACPRIIYMRERE